VYALKSRAVRDTDSVAWYPESVHLPGSFKEEILVAAMRDFTKAISELASVAVLLEPRSMDQFFEEAKGAIDQGTRFTNMYNATTAKQQALGVPTTNTDTTMVEQGVVHLPPKLSRKPKTETVSVLPPGPAPDLQPQRLIMDTTAPSLVITNHVPFQGVSKKLQVTSLPPRVTTADLRESVQPSRYPLRSGSKRNLPPRVAGSNLGFMAYHISRMHHPDVPLLDSSPTAAAYYNARVLNLLDELGNPLTYARAHRGPDADRWVSATATEYRKLLDTGTIKPIFKKDQPPDRVKEDTTYLNNVVAEKWNPDGSIKQRVRAWYCWWQRHSEAISF
jgi:hypothetical protein